MLTRVLALVCAMSAALAWAGAPSPEMKLWKTEASPRDDIIIEHFATESGKHEIWLATKKGAADQALLYAHERHADVLMSPDERWLVINDHAGSNVSEALLLRRVEGIRYSEVKEAEISAKAWRLFAQRRGLAKPPRYSHDYTNAIRWGSDSKAFLASVEGHDPIDGNGREPEAVDPWLFVFDATALRPSLDLGLLNRGALHATGGD